MAILQNCFECEKMFDIIKFHEFSIFKKKFQLLHHQRVRARASSGSILKKNYERAPNFSADPAQHRSDYHRGSAGHCVSS